MSNHATVQVRPRVDDRWLRQCGRELDLCQTECVSGLQELGVLSNRLQELNRSLLPLLRAEAAEVRQAGQELSRASQEVRALQAQLVALEQEHGTKTLQARRWIRESDLRGRELSRDLDQSCRDLATVRRQLRSFRTETQAIGTVLQTAFRAADQVLKDLKRLEAQGQRIQNRLDGAWNDTGKVRQILEYTQSLWASLEGELDARTLACDRQLTEAALLLDALQQSESAAFALWRGLREQSWELAEYRARESGVELLLRDDRQRQVAFEMYRQGRESNDLVLELDLSGFDLQDLSCECDEQLEEILEELDDLLVIEATRVERPHRRRPGDSAVTRIQSANDSRSQSRSKRSSRPREKLR